MEKSSGASTVEVVVKTALHESSRTEKRPKLAAYAFSQGGRFLAKQALNADGTATLKLAAAASSTVARVMVGPDSGDKPADLADLVRVGAVESHLRIDPRSKDLAVNLSLLPAVWLPWLEGLCCVRGTLNKGYSNGVQLPVCNAVVEIYEVEPWRLIIPRIPPWVLARLREVILGTLPLPNPVGPDPGPESVAVTSLTQAAVVLRRKVQPQRAATDFSALSVVAQNGGDFALRQALLEQELLIRPILCWLWPEFVTLHLVGTVDTDQCGHFQFCFFKGFGNTGPTNLYFKAKVRFRPFLDPELYIYIYDPVPVGCHTWWNYPCGSEVNLVTTSPWAYACPPCFPVVAPDNWVMFTAIGNTSLSALNGAGQALIPTTTASNLGLLSSGAPWGGTLLPRLDFDDSLRQSLGVQYYRVSWRRGSSGSFAVINSGDIYRHYTYTPGGSSNPVIAPYHLGPQQVGPTPGLFEIPPVVPPQGQWTIADAVWDTASAQFPTDLAGVAPGITYDGGGNAVGSDNSGLFQIRVELFDAGGNAVDIQAKGIKYVIPTSANLAQTITTADASTITQPGGGSLVQGSDLIVSVYLNNNRCHAAIAAPTINGSAADDCCGVLDYQPGDSVRLGWTALQQGNFATFGFELVRGANEVWNESGPVLSGGGFSQIESVAALMGPNANCNKTCTMAGFSQNLGVYAMATNGWSRQSEFDAYAVWAFVLAAG